MNIETIEVAYFHGTPFSNLNYKHRERFPYTKRKRNQIIDKVIETGYNVLIQTVIPSVGEGYQIIWIDKYRFQQR